MKEGKRTYIEKRDRETMLYVNKPYRERAFTTRVDIPIKNGRTEKHA